MNHCESDTGQNYRPTDTDKQYIIHIKIVSCQ